MSNTATKAAFWTQFIAGRPEFPAGDRLRAAFESGQITRLCDCGCNAFEFEVTEAPSVQRLAPSVGSGGAVFELNFHAQDIESPGELTSIEIIVFVDNRGHFSGIEVDCNSNSRPVPGDVLLQEPPYFYHCSENIKK